MEPLYLSFVIPVFNRPDEIEELLDSFTRLEGDSEFEIIIVEDGSTLDCKTVVESFRSKLDIRYLYKQNSGPGASRNYGMARAKGNYFIILDSDCLLPEQFLITVVKNLKLQYVDFFGGPDAAHSSFSVIQKAINFAMTSFLTTGGIRGGKKSNKYFQPRSFNMGISKKAFEASGGFGNIHPGEDPDLALRLKKLGFRSALFTEAFVYHKRRISWSKFFLQVYKFGMVRPILNRWHPESQKLVYWLPSLFLIGLFLSFLLLIFKIRWPIAVYVMYFLMAFFVALVKTKSSSVAIQAIFAIFIQFLGYGYGFLKSTLTLAWITKPPQQQFPNLFFPHVK